MAEQSERGASNLRREHAVVLAILEERVKLLEQRRDEIIGTDVYRRFGNVEQSLQGHIQWTHDEFEAMREWFDRELGIIKDMRLKEIEERRIKPLEEWKAAFEKKVSDRMWQVVAWGLCLILGGFLVLSWRMSVSLEQQINRPGVQQGSSKGTPP